ncbi:MAG: hypothetical protein GY711_27910 [bacterium]|nr:hypothetical protein [bacterium]
MHGLDSIHDPHLGLGWFLILTGLVSGAVLGSRFHREGFLGGYASLPRRLLRLGHVALIALGTLNVLWALTPCVHPGSRAEQLCSVGLQVGSLAMPLVCAAVAWRPTLRPLFAVPVLALLVAVTAAFIHLP